MKKGKVWIIVPLALVLIMASVLAGVGNTIPVKGKHYNLNIIGLEKNGQVGDSDGHTMFVKLNGMTKILMTQDFDGEFYVTDRNGLDGAASFNIAPGHYNVYAAALGKPNGKVGITANGEFSDAIDGTKLLWLGYVDISRTKGKPESKNINELFYVDVTLCTSVDQATGECIQEVVYEDTWVFDIQELLEYYWDYNNNGLHLLQVRFYGCSIDPTGLRNDYCRWSNGSPIVPKQTVRSI